MKNMMVITLAALLVFSGSLAAQEGSTPEEKAATDKLPKWTKTILGYLDSIEKRTVVIAEDFPEDFYNTYRPEGNEEVRTAAEILLHVAHANATVAFMISTEEQKQVYAEAHGGPPNVLDFRFVSKAETVAKVKETFAAVRQAIQENPDPGHVVGWMYTVAHSSEHFGNLVTYYRNLGLEPPTSRQ